MLSGVQSSLPRDDTWMHLVNQVHTVSLTLGLNLTGKTLLRVPDSVIGKDGLERRG